MKVADWEAIGQKVSVNVGGEVKVYKSDQICQVNPGKFDMSEDMADLTFLCLVELRGEVQGPADLHLLRTLLHRHQPVQEVPHLHPPHHGAVRGQEED